MCPAGDLGGKARTKWIIPKGVYAFCIVMLVPAFCMIGKRAFDIARARRKWIDVISRMKVEEQRTYESLVLAGRSDDPGKESDEEALGNLFDKRNEMMPNAHHVWWALELWWRDSQQVGYEFNSFGMNMFARGITNWTAACLSDVNGDGIRDGQHLGDPCCTWKPSAGRFSLANKLEYRRWHLTHPSTKPKRGNNDALLSDELDEPLDCDVEYDNAHYQSQFLKFYLHGADKGIGSEENPLNIVKLLSLLAIAYIAARWIICEGLLQDAFPFLHRSSGAISGRVSCSICIASFLYMDMTSGIIHLILDYAPFDIPVLGSIARGFQYHHDDPTGIIRITWYEYVSHIHFLIPLIYVAVYLSDASPAQRLFWGWGGVWAHLFQTAHRWAHMPFEALPQVVLQLQDWGLIIDHATHMRHHEDLEHQFTILSSHTDFIIDTLAGIVSPSRYDLWFLIGVFWFLFPICVDVTCRHILLRGAQEARGKKDDEQMPSLLVSRSKKWDTGIACCAQDDIFGKQCPA